MPTNKIISQLRKMGLVIPAQELEKPEKKNQSIDDLFDGNWISNNLGKIFLMEHEYSYSSHHGVVSFNRNVAVDKFFHLLNLDNPKPPVYNDLVCLDIETSNLSFGAGSFVFLIGLCFLSKKTIQTQLFFIESPSQEAALLSILDNKLTEFSTIFTFNGKSFDMPFLRNRFAFHKLPFSSSRKNHIDLLHLSRRIWKLRLDSCKLVDIETEILKFQRTDEEIPGWLVPQIYFDFLDQKNAELLRGVFYHNEMDVLSLVALYQYINHFLNINDVMPEHYGSDLASIAQMFQKQKMWEESIHFYEYGIKAGLDSKNAGIFYRNYGLILKKLQHWDKAIKQWKIAAEEKDYFSCIELAKYYEHHTKDYGKGKLWVEEALNIINSSSFPGNSAKLNIHLLKRIERLSRKLQKNEKQ